MKSTVMWPAAILSEVSVLVAHPHLARIERIAGILINIGADCAGDAVTGSLFHEVSRDGIRPSR
jgi:hypothetical protein